MPIPFTLDKNIPADLTKINPLLKLIAKQVFSLTKSKDESFKIKLALDEALTNAIRHGNKFNSRLKIRVRIKFTAKKATLDVCDQGEGFDYRKLPNPTAKDRLYKPSGRGLYLMRQLMDKVEFYQHGQGVRMERHFTRR